MTETVSMGRTQSSIATAGVAALIVVVAGGTGVYVFIVQSSTMEGMNESSTAIPTSTATISPTPTTAASPTPTVTPSPTATPTLTATQTPWPEATITPTPEPNEAYDIFMASFGNQLQDKPVVPIRLRGWDIVNKRLFVVVNLTADSEDSLRRLREQNGVLTAYAQTLLFYDQGKLSGEAPTGLRVLEVNNTKGQPRTFVANNSVVREWSSDQIDTVEFHSRVYSTARNQTAAEKEDARNIDRTAKNYTFHNGTATPTDE